MEIGSKAKKIIVWSASGLAAAGLLTGTFFTGMAVADNTEPASVTSEIDGERPELPQRGDHGDLPDGEDTQENGTNDDGGGQDSDSARPEKQEDSGKDDSGRDNSGKDSAPKDKPGRPDRDDNRGGRGGDGHHHGPGDGEEEAPAESAPSES